MRESGFPPGPFEMGLVVCCLVYSRFRGRSSIISRNRGGMVGLIICIIIGGILFVQKFWVGKLIGGGILYHYFNRWGTTSHV